MTDKREFLGRGWAFPVQLDPATGTVAIAEYEEDIRQAIRVILGTAPGERVMRADFGCGIYDMVFEVIDAATLTRVNNLIQQSLTQYEPRIELLRVDVDPYQAAQGRLDVSIDYRVRSTNQAGNLVYPFYFREGGQT
ncbi:GPW/gp25 family protein [Caballeronia ptereochthonis]|uniref:Gene 25-like lysozyme n=1 Tax=Caballeronia ptereochthonis TaxID=1777144 RepID=A0A158DYL7_9BURK|nr:GPW/gp25 family protein [Caballeronia ptereochthonis]SAK99725.1 Gene 25-like lysozyme [Caballeronia ptereochthonis]